MRTLSNLLVNLGLLAFVLLVGFIVFEKYKNHKDQVVAESVEKSQQLSITSELKGKVAALEKENESLKAQVEKERAAVASQKPAPDYTEKLNQLSNQVAELSNRKLTVEVPPVKDTTTPFLLSRIKSLEDENKLVNKALSLEKEKSQSLVSQTNELNSYKSKLDYYMRLDEYNKQKLKQLEQKVAVQTPVRCDPPVVPLAVRKEEKRVIVNKPQVVQQNSSKRVSNSDKKHKQVDQLN